MRTERDFEKHLRRVENCGNQHALITQHVDTFSCVTRVTFRCKSRACPVCSRKRRAEILKRLKFFSDAGKCIKLELTFPNTSPNPYTHPEYYSHAWDLFLKRVRRRYPRLKYFRVVELTKNGVPHFHILLNTPIPHTWITETFPECGGGKINYIRRVDAGRAFAYVTKYITKGTEPSVTLAAFFYLTGMRQFSMSRNIVIFAPRSRDLYVVEKELLQKVSYLQVHRPLNYLEDVIMFSDVENAPPLLIIDSDADPGVLEYLDVVGVDNFLNDLFYLRFDLESVDDQDAVIFR